MTTIAATIVTQLDGAQADGTGFAVATLAELALVLAVISVVVNLVARLIVNRSVASAHPSAASNERDPKDARTGHRRPPSR